MYFYNITSLLCNDILHNFHDICSELWWYNNVQIHLSLSLYSRHWRTSICRCVCILSIDRHLNIYTTIRLPLSIGASWSWSHGSWVSNYLFNQCLSSLTLWVRIPLRRCVLDTTLCDKVYQWHAAGRWFSPSTPVSSFRHDIAEILLKVALNTINQT
jgi:hypothetical protein